MRPLRSRAPEAAAPFCSALARAVLHHTVPALKGSSREHFRAGMAACRAAHLKTRTACLAAALGRPHMCALARTVSKQGSVQVQHELEERHMRVREVLAHAVRCPEGRCIQQLYAIMYKGPSARTFTLQAHGKAERITVCSTGPEEPVQDEMYNTV